jgi:NAD(P)-dependent dehydrogenase (short-subunit alcohol dehydrogenase family)
MSTTQQQPPKSLPPEHQQGQPGNQLEMQPQPQIMPRFPGAGRLKDKVAMITGGDSGIGQAVAVAFAREGADIVIVYLKEHADAKETQELVEKEGRKSLAISGDVGDEDFCRQAVEQTIKKFNRLDILVNNAGEQHVQESGENISKEQLEKTFRTNFFGFVYMTQAALPHLKSGSAIVNTSSVTAYKGKASLIDYASTKGAIVAYTRSLAQSLAEKNIRVNAVAPGPIWTPLIPATFDAEHVSKFGKNTPLKRAGQPNEVAPAYVFLASLEASYITGQVIHPNGGEMVDS